MSVPRPGRLRVARPEVLRKECDLSSPLPCTREKGVGGEGASHSMLRPLAPLPLSPPVQGERGNAGHALWSTSARATPRTAVLLGGLLLLPVVSLPAQTAGNSPYENVLKELVSALDGVTKVLTSVKTETDARAAVPEFKKAVSRLKEIQKQAEALPQPEKAEKDRVTRLYRSKLQDSINQLSSEVARVKAIPGGSELTALLKPVQTGVKDNQKKSP